MSEAAAPAHSVFTTSSSSLAHYIIYTAALQVSSLSCVSSVSLLLVFSFFSSPLCMIIYNIILTVMCAVMGLADFNAPSSNRHYIIALYRSVISPARKLFYRRRYIIPAAVLYTLKRGFINN